MDDRQAFSGVTEFRWRLRTLYREQLTDSGLDSLITLAEFGDEQERLLEHLLDQTKEIVSGRFCSLGLRWQLFELIGGTYRITSEFDSLRCVLDRDDGRAALILRLDQLRQDTCLSLNRLAVGNRLADGSVGLIKLKWPGADATAVYGMTSSSSLETLLQTALDSENLGKLTIDLNSPEPPPLREVASVVRQISEITKYTPDKAPQLELICDDEILRDRLLGYDASVAQLMDEDDDSVSWSVSVELKVTDNPLGISSARLRFDEPALDRLKSWSQTIQAMEFTAVSSDCPWVIWDISPKDMRRLGVMGIQTDIHLHSSKKISVTGHFELWQEPASGGLQHGAYLKAPVITEIEAWVVWEAFY